MLDKLIGAQIVDVSEFEILIKLNNQLYTLSIIDEQGDCCGFADFQSQMFFEKDSERNPIITNISLEEDDCDYKVSAKLTFFGENKELAQIDAEASSGSGWMYGASVELHCKELNICETIVEF